jgi:hypothetical protein
MSTYISEIEPTAAVMSETARPASGAGYSKRADDSERPLGAARGIISAALISIPVWALFVITLYLLI